MSAISIATTGTVTGKANLFRQRIKNLKALLRGVTGIFRRTLDGTIDAIGRCSKLATIIADIDFEEPCRRIHGVCSGNKFRAVVEKVGITVYQAGGTVGSVVGTPRQLQVAATVKELAVVWELSSFSIPVTVLIGLSVGEWRFNGRQFFRELIATRLPNGMSNKCKLAV